MNKLSLARRAAIVRALVEGTSIRSIARMNGCDKDTVLRVLVEVGEFCSLYQHHALRNLNCTRVEADEIWAFVGAKAANATKKGQGDIWTWTALCATSKLAISWLVGERSRDAAFSFVADVASRLAGRVQLSTDCFSQYRPAVAAAFGTDGVDYGQVQKWFGTPSGSSTSGQNAKGPGRYSPSPVVIGVEKIAVFGDPEEAKVATSYVERQNLTMRMSMRRFTRLTNAFSKKAVNHAHAVSLHFMVYNFVKPHGTLTKNAKGIKTTPAMACGLTNRVWTVEHMLNMIDGNILIGAAA